MKLEVIYDIFTCTWPEIEGVGIFKIVNRITNLEDILYSVYDDANSSTIF